MGYDKTLREGEIKGKVAKDYFSDFDWTKEIGDIDFCIAVPTDGKELFEQESLLWAESKRGNKFDIYESFVQLILTIGKARTFEKHLPPAFIGAFDAEKIGFLPYYRIVDIFYQNDFNWNVTPSDHTTKEFNQVLTMVKDILDKETLIFEIGREDKDLRQFIKRNFVVGKSDLSKIWVTRNNFTFVYNKWLKDVKPTINLKWDIAKNNGILDADFFLADLLSEHNTTIKENLYVLLRNNKYEIGRHINKMGLFSSDEAFFNDKQKAHIRFWNKYSRPPKRDCWDYMVQRRDLLVPQDVRERKGTFFTPKIWVEKSQQYLADVLGENWQDEYYIWDCCAGTGNMEVGLQNEYNVWASTLDQADVDVMKDQIKSGFHLLENHVFQFDFLNDDFDSEKIPEDLKRVISDPEQRKKLVIYINPPYAEGTTATTVTGTGSNKAGVATSHKTYERYKNIIGKATNEVYAQFFIRVYKELPSAMLAEFSTLKILQSASFTEFRKTFLAKLEKLFLVPSKTFDNVSGNFPIGFFIWNTMVKEKFNGIIAEAYNAKGSFQGYKEVQVDDSKYISGWYSQYYDRSGSEVGIMNTRGNDFQNQKYIRITSMNNHNHTNIITANNLVVSCIYLSVRQCIKHEWLNDRDQFFYPNDGWKTDAEFQINCLIYTLFHGQNKITATQGVNHWIPFAEWEVNAKERFESHFMSDFLAGKIKVEKPKDLFSGDASVETQCIAFLQFTNEAKAVLDAGRELWRYYHEQPNIIVNASLYDIREYFKGRNDKGRVNSRCDDEKYNELNDRLSECLDNLAEKIAEKVFKYGFLK